MWLLDFRLVGYVKLFKDNFIHETLKTDFFFLSFAKRNIETHFQHRILKLFCKLLKPKFHIFEITLKIQWMNPRHQIFKFYSLQLNYSIYHTLSANNSKITWPFHYQPKLVSPKISKKFHRKANSPQNLH